MNLSQEQQDLIRLHRWLSLKEARQDAPPQPEYMGPLSRWTLQVYAGGAMTAHVAVGRAPRFNSLGRFESKKAALNHARSIARWAADEGCPFETVWIEPHFEGEKWNPLTPQLIKPHPRRGNPAPSTIPKEAS